MRRSTRHRRPGSHRWSTTFAHAIAPVHTASDGDVIFALATGTRPGKPDVSHIGALAADVVAEAIVQAARQATGVPVPDTAGSQTVIEDSLCLRASVAESLCALRLLCVGVYSWGTITVCSD